MDAIARHEADLTAYALARLSAVPGLRLYGSADPRRAAQRLGVIPFNLGDHPHDRVATMLSEGHGIGVRNGCFCAHPYLMHLLGIPAADAARIRAAMARGDRRALPGMVRISFGLYSSVADVDRLVDALHRMATDEVAPRSTTETSA
jgi:selenocysteine lyase/cysteine desulfurase